jgi:hypothetical protein
MRKADAQRLCVPISVTKVDRHDLDLFFSFCLFFFSLKYPRRARRSDRGNLPLLLDKRAIR